jgi:hypothetical protein
LLVNTLHTHRFFTPLLFLGTFLLFQGCYLGDDNLPPGARAGDTCAQEGSSRPGLVCSGGVWVEEGALLADMNPAADMPSENNQATPPADMASTMPDMPATPVADMDMDMGMATVDMSTPVADMDMGCVPESNNELCALSGAQCGGISATDQCGGMRTINCGTCTEGTCQEDNTCSVCQPETDETLCELADATCGPLEVVDRCGQMREPSCGGCAGADTICNDSNQCECVPETDETFCGRNNAQCGMVPGQDNCGMMRTANCGGCDQGSCESDNTCSICQPETNAQFCARLGKDCGSVSAPDNCGAMRTASCGSCGADETCGSNNECSCNPLDCSNACGTLTNTCGNSANCGGCGAGEQCNNNQCVCPAASCGNAECGQVSNACGNSTMCGSCNADEQCSNNQCVCPTPVCGLNQCGTITNACGSSVDCGGCGSGEQCTNNQCVCPAVLCTVDQCGTVSNSCGNSTDCGSCRGSDVCSNNQCICTPETDQQLCNLNGYECGFFQTTDRCGTQRSVSCSYDCSSTECCEPSTGQCLNSGGGGGGPQLCAF